jgi:imidazolonepropionase-like amidohydrolase
LKILPLSEQSNPDSKIAVVGANILDSTGKQPYTGDVLIKGKRIISVGEKLSEEDLTGARIFEGKGRTLMSGMGK